ncbi:phosphatase PAP2 family protein [Sphingomonas sp. URHD0057]|uniref:phosphatase PAP2 family protein n=1 Tax=Sphingomonas sp. URHD0057 TaxID=1380389 RepID=UPI0018CC6052|nr:phosphatase PAP2 family protein [Sphingomonas sp. URHD0057]
MAGLRQGYTPGRAFERKARNIYLFVVVELAVAAAIYRALGLSFSNISLALPSGAAFLFLTSAWLGRRAGFTRVATWLEATALLFIQAAAGWALFFPATVWALPYADRWLSAADQAVGFDFPSLYRAVRNWPFRTIYHSFDWQPPLIILILVLARRDVWTFVLAIAVSLVMTAVVYPFAPAIGPVGYYGLGPVGSWTHMIDAMRDHGVRVISPKMMVGMVSLPSYHTAIGVICVWATWPLRILRWPFVAINAAMIFSTIPYGQHYLIDLIAGGAVAVVAIIIAKRLEVNDPQPSTAGS